MDRKFTRIDDKHPLIGQLNRSAWWKKVLLALDGETEINVQMRGDYLNIYYKMNNIAKVCLKPRKNVVVCLIHKEFLKDDKEPKRGYVEMTVQGDFLVFPHKANRYQYAVDLFSYDNFALLKRKVSAHVHAEKRHQSFLVNRNCETVIDAEVAFNEKREETSGESSLRRTRIDLLNYDRHLKRMVAVELKMMNNPELYDGRIRHQLQKYTEFLVGNRLALQAAYNRAISAKVELGLLGKDSFLARSFTGVTEVETRPLLVVICHDQKRIDSCRGKIIDAVKDLALGVFFFGEGGDLNIPFKRHKNKVLFL